MRTISTDNEFRQNKAFLIRYRILSEKIKRLENKLAQIDEDMAALKSPKLTGDPKASVRITLDDKLIQHDELEEKINTLLKHMRRIRCEITQCIDALDNQRQAEVLDRYYIGGIPLEGIAYEMNYTLSYITKLYINGTKSIVIK